MTLEPIQTGATIFRETMDEYRRMVREGVSSEDAAKGLAFVLRSLLPSHRDWHAECEQCGDTGWHGHECQDGARCQRPHCRAPHAIVHTYVTVCACRATNRTYQRHHALEGPTADPMGRAARVERRR